MISVLIMLLATALFVGVLGLRPRAAGLARLAAVLGVGMGLGLALAGEGLQGDNLSGTMVAWPQALEWLGLATYRSDALSAGLGAWCLLLGGLCLLRVGNGRNAPWHLALALLTIATLYSLVHTLDLLLYAAHVLFLALLALAYHLSWGAGNDAATTERQILALGIGATLLLAAVLLIGRTTGGIYGLTEVSLSALTVWPLLLVAAFVFVWLGVAPTVGWSGHWRGGPYEALVQSLVLGVPVLSLLLRLQALVSDQTLASAPLGAWDGFTTSLAWAGAVTAIVAGAGTVVWAQTSRWASALTAHWLGLMLWAISLDTHTGRVAALALLLAYGVGRVALELATSTNTMPETQSTGRKAIEAAAGGMALLSLAMIPLTSGFIGVWFLGAALVQDARPSLALLMLGAVILNACGLALHAPGLLRIRRSSGPGRPMMQSAGWVELIVSTALLLGGVAPAMWLPHVEAVASMAGGRTVDEVSWLGLQANGVSAPVLLLGVGTLFLAAVARLFTLWARSGVIGSGTLLPTGMERLGGLRGTPSGEHREGLPPGLMRNSPLAFWALSLAWLEIGLTGIGAILQRIGAGAGSLLGRLEGRFYLPLALILTVMALIAITR
jgi:hypothetical protein